LAAKLAGERAGKPAFPTLSLLELNPILQGKAFIAELIKLIKAARGWEGGLDPALLARLDACDAATPYVVA